MKLRYHKDLPTHASALVLTRDIQRVELHLRRDDQGTTTLLAYAGTKETAPENALQQGPYESLDQAVAARNAIAGELQAKGYRYRPQSHPRWSLVAQRDIRQARSQKNAKAGDYRFDPKDVFLDW